LALLLAAQLATIQALLLALLLVAVLAC